MKETKNIKVQDAKFAELKNEEDTPVEETEKKGETLCLDSLTGQYFKSNIEDVRHSINLANEELLHEGWLSRNEFYKRFWVF